MSKEWKTHKWEMFIIPERILKNYDGMSIAKTRPIIVVSNAKSLDYKALIMECSTKKHKNSLFFYKWKSKKTNSTRTSYIAMDGIHTIDVSYLKDENKIKSRIVPMDLRKIILEYINSIVNSK